MFEGKQDRLIPTSMFLNRVIKYFGYASALISASLLLGVVGYHYLAALNWIDSLYNASMILTGMGPVSAMLTVQAKLFSSFYALFSGIAFLSTVGLFFTPIAHRILHIFHLENDEATAG